MHGGKAHSAKPMTTIGVNKQELLVITTKISDNFV